MLEQMFESLENKKAYLKKKLAEYVALERETIRSIETARSFVSSDSLAKLANFFNVEPEYFFKQNLLNILVKT